MDAKLVARLCKLDDHHQSSGGSAGEIEASGFRMAGEFIGGIKTVAQLETVRRVISEMRRHILFLDRRMSCQELLSFFAEEAADWLPRLQILPMEEFFDGFRRWLTVNVGLANRLAAQAGHSWLFQELPATVDRPLIGSERRTAAGE